MVCIVMWWWVYWCDVYEGILCGLCMVCGDDMVYGVWGWYVIGGVFIECYFSGIICNWWVVNNAELWGGI